MSQDLTAIFYSSNKTPPHFARAVREHLLSVLGDTPLISVTQKPEPLMGENICIGEVGASVPNLYKQVLIGARAARTKYVAMCEDDVLTTREFFTMSRPQEFAYNYNKWSLYTWMKEPLFSYKERCCLNQLVANRQLLTEHLEERFRYAGPLPLEDVLHEPGRRCAPFGFHRHRKERFETPDPAVVFSHLNALDATRPGRLGIRKRMGPIQRDWLPCWGTAVDVMTQYVGYDEWLRQIAEAERRREGMAA